ncbi:MAG: Ig-like domain-containing protein, partial [Ginsengibacter sp.]
EGVIKTTFYRDADGDGFGNAALTTQACSAPAGYVSNNTDCNDANAAVHPGATEVCNGIDDDCDGQIDEGVIKTTFYRDADGDGFGNAALTTQACSVPAGYVSNNTDCNDANAAVHPGATEVVNGIDDDCDNQVDETSTLAPVVTITNPVNNTSFATLADITVNATALVAGGTISKVEFLKGSSHLYTSYNAPYKCIWRNVPEGDYTITAKATDNLGRVTISAPVSISVVSAVYNQPPTVSITSPANGAGFIAPADITINAMASDADGTISKVEFLKGNLSHLYNSYAAPYHCIWRNVPAGQYIIRAKATDNFGEITLSAPVTITVASPEAPQARSSSVSDKIDINSAMSLKLAPNPANDILNIYTTGLQKNKQLTISVISASGVVMKTIQSTSLTQAVKLNISSLLSGVYTIRIMSEDGVLYKQFVKL